jgi:hypothetical protein
MHLQHAEACMSGPGVRPCSYQHTAHNICWLMLTVWGLRQHTARPVCFVSRCDALCGSMHFDVCSWRVVFTAFFVTCDAGTQPYARFSRLCSFETTVCGHSFWYGPEKRYCTRSCGCS